MMTLKEYELDTTELCGELERALGEHWHAPQHIARLTRRACPYRTSFALDELDVSLEDGRKLQMVYKDMDRRSLHPTAQRVKPEFVYHPTREIETYRQILMPSGLSTATFYGAVVQPRRQRYALFLERVAGQELDQVGDFQVWEQVARWLAGMHVQFGERAKALKSSVPLLIYDGAFYRRWMARALRFSAGTASAAPIEMLARRYDLVIDRLLGLGETLLHGEFYPSNVLVVPQETAWRICPVDWEMAGLGPGLVDLGALIAGSWSDAEKHALAHAYYLALPEPRAWEWEEFLKALDYIRLHLAVQWLGWSPDWSPPREHAHDWLREALALAEEVKL